ncbi:ROK family protein [Lactobacillus sp. LC28-10]|uniref:ROK family protein n=1 Tax=Secundilactobacillus angelensis TaxID=2722706 RepID=A0ABX1KYG3_9LACO|nr:ROK family protein [Secundilactobacillus angelensis]MCH5463427.1 ROK family protein [Secundilactobacillus angelensis]NLR18320.1 ROK family protein [Secundilactobacillus angelensis]
MYLGIDLGGTNIKIGLLKNDLTVQEKLKVPTESETDSNRVMTNLIAGVKQLLVQTQTGTDQIKAIGIGVPGQMNIQKGLSIFSPNFANWSNVPVVQLIENEFHVPTYMDNDVRVNLYGEWQLGAGKGKQDVLMVTLGTGLGAAMITDGRMMYGKSNSAAELGHLNMYRHGRPCACGSSGCLGRYVSARGMVKTVQEHLAAGETSVISEWIQGDESQITAKMVSDAYDQDDQVARKVMQETGEILGYGLSSAINMFNPERLIIGGGVAAAGERLLKSTKEVIAGHALKVARDVCDLVPAELGPWAGMIGAGVYANQQAEK